MAQLEDAFGDEGLAVAYGLFCSRGIGASEVMKTAFRQTSSAMEREFRLHSRPHVRAENAGPFKHVIDMKITYDRLYLATEHGLFIGDLHPDQLEDERRLDLASTREGECISVNTGLRAVSASFGLEGFLVIANEPDQSLGPRKEWMVPVPSVRTSIGGSTLANFPSQEEIQRIPVTLSRGRNPRQVALVGMTLDGIDNGNLSTVSEGGYVLWDSRHRRIIDVAAERTDEMGRWVSEDFIDATAAEDTTTEQIISASFTGNSFLAMETSEGMILTRDGENRLVQTGPTISMRTYWNSWRFRRLATATSREGLWLYAAFAGDDELP